MAVPKSGCRKINPADTPRIASAGITVSTLAERAMNLHNDSTGQTDNGNDMPVEMHSALAADHRDQAAGLRAAGDLEGAKVHEIAADAHDRASELAARAIDAGNAESEGRGTSDDAEGAQEKWLDASERAANASSVAERHVQRESSAGADNPKVDAATERRDYGTASEAANDAVSKVGDPDKADEASAIHSALARHHESQWGQARDAGDAETARAHKEASIAHSEASVFLTPEASRKAADLTAGTERVTKGDVPGHEFHGNQWTESGKLAERANDLSDRWGLDDRKTDADDHRALAREHTRIGHDIYRVIHNGQVWEPHFQQKMTQIANAHLRAADAHRNAADARHDAEMGDNQRQRAVYRASDASEEARDLEKENPRELESIKNRVAELGPELTNRTTSGIIGAVMANGGATISQAGVAPKNGYIVATDPELGDKLSGDDFRNTGACKAKLAEFIMRNQADLASGTKYLGLWHQTQDEQGNPVDEVHLDIVEKIDDVDEAIRAGQDRNQISIWDVVNAREIPTGGTGSEKQE